MRDWCRFVINVHGEAEDDRPVIYYVVLPDVAIAELRSRAARPFLRSGPGWALAARADPLARPVVAVVLLFRLRWAS